jgi:Family of unknown function (DUF6399)
MVLEPLAHAREHAPGPALMALALAGLPCTGRHSPRNEAPGRLASGEHPLGGPHSPDVVPVPQALRQAVAAPLAATPRAASQAVGPAEGRRKRRHERGAHATGASAKRGPGRPPTTAGSREQVAPDVEAARQEPQRLTGQREPVTQRRRASGRASHVVAFERGVRRHGTRRACELPPPLALRRPGAQQARRSEPGLERLAQAARVGPTLPATIDGGSGDGRQQGRHLAWAPPASSALPAQRLPSSALARVAAPRTVPQGAPLRERAAGLRPPRFAPGGALGALRPMAQTHRQPTATTRAEGFQRSSAKVAGRTGYRSRRHHQRRGLAHPRQRACLTAVPHFFRTRGDGTTAAARGCGQKPRAMCAAILVISFAIFGSLWVTDNLLPIVPRQ